MKKNPYEVVKHRHTTEKSTVLETLKDNTSNPSVRKFESPKYVFVVDTKANKQEIKWAVEEIYKDRKVKVVSVNTLNVKPKHRRVRGRSGMKKSFKKAVITFEKGDSLDTL